jgi:hypothetical protein
LLNVRQIHLQDFVKFFVLNHVVKVNKPDSC